MPTSEITKPSKCITIVRKQKHLSKHLLLHITLLFLADATISYYFGGGVGVVYMSGLIFLGWVGGGGGWGGGYLP